MPGTLRGTMSIWEGPATPDIEYVDGRAVQSNTMSPMPTHAAGDLLVMFAFRDGSTSAAAKPAGWIQRGSGVAANACWAGMFYRWALTSSETSGTWTGATGLACHSYRGVTGMGSPQNTFGASNTLSYLESTPFYGPDLGIPAGYSPAVKSWVARFAGHRTATDMSANTPAGHVGRTAAGDVRGIDTNSDVTTWPLPAATQVVNASSGWLTCGVELSAATGVLPAHAFTDDFAVFDGNKWSTDYPSNVSVADGRLTYTTGSTPNDFGVFGYPPLDLRGSSVTVQDWTPDTNAGFRLPLILQSLFSSEMGVDALYFFVSEGGVITNDWVTELGIHTPGDWYRIREASGTVYYEQSHDGTNWTVFFSEPTPPYAACAHLALGQSMYGTVGQPHIYDNLNISN